MALMAPAWGPSFRGPRAGVCRCAPEHVRGGGVRMFPLCSGMRPWSCAAKLCLHPEQLPGRSGLVQAAWGAPARGLGAEFIVDQLYAPHK
mmetsp:Transcript_25732/g.34817  ORF Transcript_25732/g.34817 Transcript_25732/m.34817 type:complete len:90 (+) Transcript_25732:51-320(+)